MDNKPTSIWGWIFLLAAIATIVTLVYTVIDHSKIAKPQGSNPPIETYKETEPPKDSIKEIYSISFDRTHRYWQGNYFKGSATKYNRLDQEVVDCVGCSFYYSATSTSGGSCAGTRDIYVRNKDSEQNKYDGAWKKVASFDYDKDGKVVYVDATWQATDVYAIAVYRQNASSDDSFTADWGNELVLYYVNDLS